MPESLKNHICNGKYILKYHSFRHGKLQLGIPAPAASAIDQWGNAWRACLLPIDFVHAAENCLARPKTTSETVKMEMNVVMAIHDFFSGILSLFK